LPFLKIEITVMEWAAEAAPLIGVHRYYLVGALEELWKRCFDEQTDIITEMKLRGLFAIDHPQLIDVLVGYEWLERREDGKFRVKGMEERYLRHQRARAEQLAGGRAVGGKARMSDARRGPDGRLLPKEPATDQQEPAGAPARASRRTSNLLLQDQDQDQDEDEKNKALSADADGAGAPGQVVLPLDDGMPFGGLPPPERVFELWKQLMNSPTSKLDKKRRRLIELALKSYSLGDCMWAVNGCASSPFHMGDNDKRQRYNSIELIFRDHDHIDKFKDLAVNPVTRRRL
jgi:hypothetical protein